MVRVLRTPARLNVSLTSHVYTWKLPMTNIVSRFVKDESGATAIEYALIAGGISVVIVVAVNLVGTSLIGTFNNVAALFAPAA
jgi:pilus assembly protein Flp/PilA